MTVFELWQMTMGHMELESTQEEINYDVAEAHKDEEVYELETDLRYDNKDKVWLPVLVVKTRGKENEND